MSTAKICPQCEAEYPLDQRFCPIDGATLRTQGASGDLAGSVVADRYYVMRKLGEGGMGQVYLAEHVRMGRKSALKVMHPRAVHDADAISRFNREAANASRISHPNVAAIHDFGETSEGLIYLAMEYVEGEPLTALVERTGALPPLRAADLVRQTADALHAAHDMGIVHRDLKPDNIMLTRNRDGSDCVKVVDFGIAKAQGTSQKVTKTGLIVGTPEYMSPEQLAGDTLDGRSDIYALGLVAFHLLTGRLPFPSESAQESMIMRLTERPRRRADVRDDVAGPAELQAVRDRALERDASRRYANAAEFGRDFARAVERMPESAAATAGTVVIGARGAAADGATAIVPATRVDSIVAPKSRTAILVAASVLVVLGIGAAALKFVAADDAGAGAGDSVSAITAQAEDPAPASKTAVGEAEAPATPPTNTEIRQAAPEQGTVRPMGAALTPPEERATPAPSVEATLRRVEDLTGSEATAREAIRELNRIAGRLVRGSEDHVWAQLLRAEAHAALDQGEQMCSVLGTIQGLSDDATRNGRIATLRSACP